MIRVSRVEQLHCKIMWCPSVSLSIWANAWLAGKAAPDDVLDALSLWAPTQSVAAYDAVAAGHTGLPWPDVHDAGTVSLLQTLRAAVGRRRLRGTINVVLPVPGDVRGLAAGTQFEHDALAAGEAVIVANPEDPGGAVGLVPGSPMAMSTKPRRASHSRPNCVHFLGWCIHFPGPQCWNTTSSAMPNTRCGQRCARPPKP